MTGVVRCRTARGFPIPIIYSEHGHRGIHRGSWNHGWILLEPAHRPIVIHAKSIVANEENSSGSNTDSGILQMIDRAFDSCSDPVQCPLFPFSGERRRIHL